jgi:hypothetical protein
MLFVVVLAGGFAGCGNSSVKTKAPPGWTASEQSGYLASCHKVALKGVSGVTMAQQHTYCTAQLKLAQKHNPAHTDVHGFVGEYSGPH